jgi:hypothetical protein
VEEIEKERINGSKEEKWRYIPVCNKEIVK